MSTCSFHSTGTRFTCFNSTKVQILTPEELRLDSCTTGLVALARTKDAARAFNALQEEDRSVQVETGADGEAGGNYLKIYRACFLAPISGPPAFLQLAAAAAATAAAAAAGPARVECWRMVQMLTYADIC